jgi:alcohol dehydrogenase class IV
VRSCGTPHAETNAVMLPHSARFMAGRAPRELGAFAAALGDPEADPGAAGDLIASLAALAGSTRLSDLGVTSDALHDLAAAAAGHPALQNTPGGVSREDLQRLFSGAL